MTGDINTGLHKLSEGEIAGRLLQRREIGDVWQIDRREIVESVYYLESGRLVLKPERWQVAGWPAGEAATYTPLLLDCFDRGGWCYGLFDAQELIGAAFLESKFIGLRADLLQLKFMHVSCAYRGRGLGGRLFTLAVGEARTRGAHGLYISATPSENTINFYLRRGCVPASSPDPELLALEPEDIHLECAL
jgi:predicted N-acetyltransferase YhbS